jgi:hypothetical protein
VTIKDRFNTNKLDLSFKDGIEVNDLLYIKHDSAENKVMFFPILSSDIQEVDGCISIDDLSKDKFVSTFIINDNLFMVERGETDEV